MDLTPFLDKVPAGTPPPGVQSDFLHGHNHGSWTLHVVVLAACIVVSTVIVVLRMLTRILVIKKVDWSDYLCVVGWSCNIAFYVIALVIDDTRMGRHLWDMSAKDFLSTLELENIASLTYNFAILFLKLSILCLFMEILIPMKAGPVYFAYMVLIVSNIMLYVGGNMALLGACIPRAKITKPWLPGRCINVDLYFLISGSWNVVSDFFIVVFPIWAIWRLKLPVRRRIGVSIVFGMSLFALLCSIMRLYSSIVPRDKSDLSWVMARVAMWAAAETCFVALCACMPFIPRAMEIFRRKPSAPSLDRPFPKSLEIATQSTIVSNSSTTLLEACPPARLGARDGKDWASGGVREVSVKKLSPVRLSSNDSQKSWFDEGRASHHSNV